MRAHSTSLLRVVLAALFSFVSLGAWATAPKAPTITTKNEAGNALTNAQIVTTLPTGARGFLIQWTDNSNDEDFFVVYARKGTSGAFGRTAQVPVNTSYCKIILPASQTFAVGTVFQFAVVACKGAYNEERRLLLEDGTAVPNGYRAKGWAKVSEQSAMSSPITATWPSVGTDWKAPGNFVASAAPGTDGSVLFTFDDNSTTENGFILNVKLNSQPDSTTNSSGTPVSNWLALQTHTGTGTETDYDDSDFPFNRTSNTVRLSLTPGVKYDFRVCAVRTVAAGGSLESTAWSNVSTLAMPPLTAASQLVAESPAENTINFSWTDMSNNEQEYFLERKLTSSTTGPWTTYQTYSSNANSVVVNPFEDPGVSYDWRVSAAYGTGTMTGTASLTGCVLNGAGSGAGSTTVTCASTTSLNVGATLTGTDISFTGGTTINSASVTTPSTSTLAVGMYIQGTGIPTGARIITIDSVTAFTMTLNATATASSVALTGSHLFPGTKVTSLIDGTNFAVSVPAYVNTSASPIALTATTVSNSYARGTSNVVSVTTKFNAPTNLVATVDNDPTAAESKVTLSWTDNSNAEDGFEIRYRLDTDSTYKTAALINGNTTTAPRSISYTLTGGLPEGKLVDVQVRAVVVNSAGTPLFYSAPSNEVQVTPKNGFTSKLSAFTTRGSSLSYTVATSSDSTISSVSVTGLPAGVTFSSGTLAVSGTPTEAGRFSCPMKVTFADGKTASDTLQLRILEPKLAPILLPTSTNRTIGRGKSILIPLNEIFSDPDTEAAVKFTVQIGSGAPRDMNVILYKTQTPQTVSNFMNYVLSNDYENVVFHRALKPATDGLSIVQAGSFKLIPALSTTSPLFTQVLSRSSPQNEPGIPDLSGTIAMAKVGANPNSATHDFFFNYADNSTSLDSQDAAFHAFGRVADPGLSVLTDIAALSATSGQSGFDNNGNQLYSDAPFNTTPVTDLRSSISVRDPRGGPTSSQKIANFPITGTPTPAPHTITPTEMVVIKSVTPVTDVLSYINLGSSNNTVVGASIVNGALKIDGTTVGTAVVSISAKDLDGNVVPQTFNITVNDTYVHPLITKHPVNVTVNQPGNATLSITAVGTDLTYQWKKDGKVLTNNTTTDGTVITGVNTATLTLAGSHVSDTGAYTVVVSNLATSVTSNVAQLSVLKAPTITTDPSNVTVNYLGAATLSVVATGTPPLKYQWKFKAPGMSLVDVPAGVTSTISLSPASKAYRGEWSVTVSNAAGNVTSAVATVTVNVPDTDGDGVDDEDEDTNGTSKYLADTDGDGYSDGVEKNLSTNPKAASSTPGAKFFVAERDGSATMSSLLMKRIPANVELASSAFWLGATEVTNKQFASMLQYGLTKMIDPTTHLPKIKIIAASSRLGVYYDTDLTNPICYLSDTTANPSTDISFVSTDATNPNTKGSFTVPVALANAPVRGVSWFGSYFAATALNSFNGYTAKSLPSTKTFADSATQGYRIPFDAEWIAAALNSLPQSIAIYPTGSTLSSSQAWFGQTSATARPKNVGSYSVKNFGVSDLAGNVAEWVSDGTGTSTTANVRGGSYADADTLLSATSKLKIANPENQARTFLDKRFGIRLALDAPATPTVTVQAPSYATTASLTAPYYMLVRTDETLSINATVTGAPALTYQWLRNNAAVSNQTAKKLSITAPTLASAGSYQLRVTSNGDTANAATSAITKVSMVQLPATRLINVAANKNATLTVPYTAASGETLSFTWFGGDTRLTNRGSFLTGVDTNSLVFKGCQPADTADYTCEVRDTHGTPAVMVTFRLVVFDTPQVDAPIFADTTMVGETFYYSVYHKTTTYADLTTAGTKYSATGLPNGLTINSTTGVISGKPRVSGTFAVVITTTNATGTSKTSSVNLVVKSMDEMLQSNAVGSFFGLIARHKGLGPVDVGLNDELGGRIDFTVTKAATLSGRVTLGSSSYSFSGTLDTTYNPSTPISPTANILIKRTGKNPIGLSLRMSVTSAQTFSGTIAELNSDGSTTGRYTVSQGWRNVWNSTTSKAVNYDGKHNILLRIPTGFIGDQTVPQGSGYASINVSLAGATTLTGKLPDGTAISFSSFLGPNGQQPLYQVLYSGKGSIIGWATEGADSTHLFSGTEAYSWLKKAQLESSKDRYYKLTGIDTSLTPVGGKYLPPDGYIIMGLSGVVSPNARLTFDYEGTSFTQDFDIKVPATTSFTGVTVNNSTTCKITASSGAFTGTFKLAADGRSATYQGLIIPDPNHFGYGIGEGYFTLPKVPAGIETTSTSPILSQWVGLGAKP